MLFQEAEATKSLSSNLVKSYYTTKETSAPRIIDNNSVIEELVEKLRLEATDNLTVDDADNYEWEDFSEAEEGDGEFRTEADFLDALTGEAGEAADSNSENVSAPSRSNLAAEAAAMREKILAQAEEERKKIIDDATAEAVMIKNLAKEEDARDRALAMEAAKNDGFEVGMQKANEEFEKLKKGLEAQRARLEEEYEDKMFELEPQFVRHITNIYEKVFQIELSDQKDIVLNVLRTAMQKIEGTKNYIIHVSRDDYNYVSEKKGVLLEAALAADVIIDVVEDMTMKRGDCMIETANGIFDCGIDTQLAAIKKRLTLLSYDGRD